MSSPSPSRAGRLPDVQALLRETAVGAVTRGWPIVAGTYPADTAGRWCGRHGSSDATGLGPLDERWPDQPITTWEQAHATWSHRRYGVLLVCGHGVDAVELPTPLAAAVLLALDTAPVAGPVVALGADRWLVLVASGAGLLPAMAAWPRDQLPGAELLGTAATHRSGPVHSPLASGPRTGCRPARRATGALAAGFPGGSGIAGHGPPGRPARIALGGLSQCRDRQPRNRESPRGCGARRGWLANALVV
ncbi:MAG TPA: bifunctional DNA primase/polymerase [Pseudonocardiaceae bacterium]|jgi:hypothetical protein|nr:bifunctional DNA primase/polymerase [Pseudonocardiaceae bacterium]